MRNLFVCLILSFFAITLYGSTEQSQPAPQELCGRPIKCSICGEWHSSGILCPKLKP